VLPSATEHTGRYSEQEHDDREAPGEEGGDRRADVHGGHEEPGGPAEHEDDREQGRDDDSRYTDLFSHGVEYTDRYTRCSTDR